MTERGLISVVIPVYNGERYLTEALDSVLAQRYPDIEIIVVNDGSTDRTEEIMKSHAEVRYFSQSRQGAAAARNSGVNKSSGEFLAFLDADDLWTKDKLRVQTALFRADPGLDMVFGHVEQFYSPELEGVLMDRIYLPSGSMPGYLPGAMIVRKDAFLRAGSFDAGFRIGEFIDWYLRAQECGLRSHICQEVVLKRRIHNANTGIRERDARRDYLRVLKASLDRRRASVSTTGGGRIN